MEIGIVGLGLIGGSLAIDLRRQGHRILGVSRRQATCSQAIDRGIVDQASPDLSLLATAEVIFLCTPLHSLETTVDQLLPYLSKQTILTDVGSVKSAVVEAITPKWSNFVGGHPMAGKAESGLEVAQADLFVDRAYVLTPSGTTPAHATETVAQLAQSLRSRLFYCDPEAHDRAVAWISHLPVMVSASLIAACLTESDRAVLDLAQQLASSGFRDTSRVGGGNPELGVMMARYNQHALLQSLYQYRQQLDQVIQQIEQSDWSALEEQPASSPASLKVQPA
ncbi:MAG: prephenate/arogenate dehydrogenase [Elainella sp. Prado103]|nr:prephenate/arogenate dehydrogenase [Elainella sp. Prado103]